MRNKLPASEVLLFGLIIVLMASACTPQAPAKAVGQAEDSLSGTLTVSGAFALYPMMIRWGEEFSKLHPQVRFDISAGGAGKGMSDALSGAVDIGMVSRSIKPEEEAKGAYWLSVTKDAVFVVVNTENPVWDDLHRQGFSRQILEGIYITGEIQTWGQAVGRPEVIDPIHVFTRSDAAGAPEEFAKFLGKLQEDLLGVGVFGDPGLLDAVARDPLGIGFNNLNYVYDFESGEPTPGVAVAPLDVNSNGQAEAAEVYDTKAQAIQAVLNGRYPSPPARNLNLVTKGVPQGLVKAFIEWVLTDGQAFVSEAGYIQLADEQLLVELEKLR